jgi:hypothetical protein
MWRFNVDFMRVLVLVLSGVDVNFVCECEVFCVCASMKVGVRMDPFLLGMKGVL